MAAEPASSVRHQRPGTSWLFYLDVLRIVAILGVVAIHNWSLLHVLEPGTRRWWLDAVFFTAGRWAVPVFIMISGSLLLQPRRRESAGEFYRRRLWRVGIPALFWIPAYFVFRATVLEQSLTWNSIITDLVAARPFTHLYFLYVIIGLYLVTPLLRPFVASVGRGAVAVAAVLLLGAWALDAFFGYAFRTGTGVSGLTYWFPFLGYYLAGFAVSGLSVSRRAVTAILVAVAAVIALQVVTTTALAAATDGAWTNWPQSYWSPFTILAALGLFAAASRSTPSQHQPGRMGRAVRRIAEATFGVYLLHEMILYWHAINFVHGTPEQLVTARIPTYFVAVIASFVIVIAVRRVPYMRSFA